MITTSFYNTNCFIAYLRYHRIFKYHAVQETEHNFICYVCTPNVERIKEFFTNVERAKVSKKITDNAHKTYKVYLSKEDLVKEVVILHFRKNGRPDMRFHSNVLAAHQTRLNVFFSTTIAQIKDSKITPYLRKALLINWNR